MGVGDYLSNMFLGNSGEPSDESKKTSAELWKIYQQAYNVKPVWDGKKWAIPPGAVQRFQMLLPMLQAQAAANRTGTGAQGNDKGLLAGLLGSAGKGILGAVGTKLGGWEGAMDKVGGAVKDMFSGWGGGQTSVPDWRDSLTQQPEAWDTGPSMGQTDIPDWRDSLPTDMGDFGQAGNDWWADMPAENIVEGFSPEDYAMAGDWW